MFFPVLVGQSCNYDDTFAPSNNGQLTLDYAYPYVYLVEEGASPAFNGKLYIYAVSDAGNPVLLSTTSLPAGSRPWNPRIYGNKLYIPYGKLNYLAIWDVTDRTAPSLLGSVDLSFYVNTASGGIFCVAVIGTNACVGNTGTGGVLVNQKGLIKVDVSDPTNPTVLASLRPINAALSSSCTAVNTAAGNFVAHGVVSGGASAPYVAAVDPSTFTTTGSNSFGAAGGTSSRSLPITEDGDYAFFFNGGGGIGELKIYSVDISNPASISQADATATIAALGPGGNHYLCLVDATHRLYVGNNGGLGYSPIIQIVDVTDPTDLQLPGTISTGSTEVVTGMAVINGCAGFTWAEGGDNVDVHLLGTAPLS